eukprot:m51a1_g5806 putative n-acetyl-d-glucosaminylphosphatidylinositol de-n-acetylase (120) ;mRNA; r:137119-137988
MILTFDEGGVSGHLNHIAASLGSQLYVRRLADNGRPAPALYLLRSAPLALKYTAWLGAALELLLVAAGLRGPRATAVCSPRPLVESLRGMLRHPSQLVWFRWLFVGASQYSYANTLLRV